MASAPQYSVSFAGITKHYDIAVSADDGTCGRQFLELVEAFKPVGIALGSFFLRGPDGRPVVFRAGLRGNLEIVSTIGTQQSRMPAKHAD